MGFLIRLIIFPILLFKRILFPMAKGVLKTPFRILKIFLKSSILIYLVAFVILYFAIQSWTGNGTSDSGPAPVMLTKEDDPRTRAKLTELPPLPATILDGNSSFTKKFWGKMKPQEQAIYTREFTYAMHYTPPGEAHLFTTPGNILYGSITPGEVAKSKTGIYCRNFEEVIVLRGEAQRYHGKGCQRAGGVGWCKLGPQSTPNCELGYSEGWMGDIRRTMRRWF